MPGVFVSDVGCRFEVTARMAPPALLIVIAEARLVRAPGPPP
jgi:hypothetical protein